MDGWAAHPMGWGGDGVVASPVEAPGVSLIARRCLSGATPRGQSWTSAGLLPHGRNGLNAQRMAVVSTFREPSLCRHVPRELWRSVWLDLPPIIAVTACHQRNCVERYSRYIHAPGLPSRWSSLIDYQCTRHSGWVRALLPRGSAPARP